MRLFLKTTGAAIALMAVAACGGSSGEASAPQKALEASPEAVSQTEAPETAPVETETAVTEPDQTPAPVVAATDEAIGSPEFAELPAPYNEADYARGKRVYKLCVSCHLIEKDAGNLVGPNLHGLFDRKTAALDDFNYSDALQEADFMWTPEKLEEWLANPRGFLPGNRMSFAGVRKPTDRHAVIAYLMVESAK